MTAPINVDKALATIGALFESGDVFEIRALNVDRSPTFGGATHSGYFEFAADRAITKALQQLNGRAEGIYVVLNRLNPALLARAKNRLQVKPKNTTTDADIIKLRWLYIDCDPRRAAGISSTDAEHAVALQRAGEIRDFLSARGWTEPIYCDSGNGAHLLYLLPDLELDRAGALVKAFLKALALRFSDQVIIVDESTGNASRICKLYGTLTQKGDATPDRPHRYSRILEQPERALPVSVAAIEALAAEVVKAAPRPVAQCKTTSAGTFNIDEWIAAKGFDVVKGPEPYKGVRRWILRLCPFEPTHEKPAIIELPNGALAYKCLHKSCSGKKWRAFRVLVETGRKPGMGNGPGTDSQPASDRWEPPMPFHRFNLPAFPTEILPPWLGAFVEAEATATQTPTDLAGMLALSVVAASCAKKVVVQVRDGYSEPVNIFTVTALPPGNRKTAVFSAVTRPLDEYERSEAKRTAGELAQAKTAYKIKESCLKRLQEQAVTATGKKREELTREATLQAAELAETVTAAPTRCLAEDCTAEKLAGILRDQGGRIAVMSPEGDVFDLMAGRYSAKTTSNFGVFLKGHAGDSLRVDRVGRPPEFVPQPALTMGLAVQPDVIRGLAQKPEFRGRGLLGRFLYAMPASLLGRREINPRSVPEALLHDYREKVLALLNLRFDKDFNGDPCPHALNLDTTAAARLFELDAWVEPQLSEFGDLGRITDWAGKLVGAVVRIAGLLHMAKHAGVDEPWQEWISRETVEQAIGLGMYFIPHAKAAYAEMGADETVELAKVILRWISHTGLNSFTKRDVHQGTRGTFKRAADVDAPLGMLVERGFVRQRQEASAGGPGRHPSATYDVNPKWVRQSSDREQGGNSEYCEDSEKE